MKFWNLLAVKCLWKINQTKIDSWARSDDVGVILKPKILKAKNCPKNDFKKCYDDVIHPYITSGF